MGFDLCFKGILGLEGGKRKGSKKTGCGGAVETSWHRRQEKISTSLGSQGRGLEEGHPGSQWRRLSEWPRWQQYVHAHMHKEGPEDNPVAVHPVSRQHLALAWHLPIRPCWLTSDPKRSACLSLSHSGVTNACPHFWLFYVDSEAPTWVFGLAQHTLHGRSHPLSPRQAFKIGKGDKKPVEM